MKRCWQVFHRMLLGAFSLCLGVPSLVAEQPDPAAVAGFNSYIRVAESRLALQHQSQTTFLAGDPLDASTRSRLRQGDLLIDNLAASDVSLPGALVHDWRGKAFVPGAKVADFERVMKDFGSYPRYYAPQILRASSTSEPLEDGTDRFRVSMRVRQKHVITVVLDMNYEVAFAVLDQEHGYSISRSSRIREIDASGTGRERILNPEEEHGLLWRLNTYWTYEEGDGGLYMQIETISLTRSIPTGLGWIVKPFVESVPRDSLEFTLRSTCNLLRR